jgi:hypothetical protein
MTRRRPDDFKVGIAFPLLRSLALVLGLLLIAVIVGAIADNGYAFYATLVAGCATLWLLDARIRPNKQAEDSARRRYFGMGD